MVLDTPNFGFVGSYKMRKAKSEANSPLRDLEEKMWSEGMKNTLIYYFTSFHLIHGCIVNISNIQYLLRQFIQHLKYVAFYLIIYV